MKGVKNMKKKSNQRLDADKRPAPIPQGCVISNKYYDLKHGGKAGRRARKAEDRNIRRDYM